MHRFVLAAVAALAVVAAPSAAPAAGLYGKIIFRNYSSAEVVVGQVGVEGSTLVMAPKRGRATYRGVDKLATYVFAMDANGDFIADNEFAVNLEGLPAAKITVGDLGVLGIVGGP